MLFTIFIWFAGMGMGFVVREIAYRRHNMLDDEGLTGDHSEKYNLLEATVKSRAKLKEKIETLAYMYGVDEVDAVASELKCGVLSEVGYGGGQLKEKFKQLNSGDSNGL